MDLIKNVKDPSINIQLEAVKQNGLSILYLTDPSEEVQLEAIRQNITVNSNQNENNKTS